MVVRILHRDMFVAQGRLTLASAVPVMTTGVAGASTIYYTPYNGDLISYYDGARFNVVSFSQMSQTLADATKSPAAAAASKVYDMFVWNDASTFRCTRGPAWTSGTVRGTGAGTTELDRFRGVWVNAFAITNGPAANQGVYVGTISTNAAGTSDFTVMPAAAAGGSANNLGVWNTFNRTMVKAVDRDSTDSWTYTTAAFSQMNAGTAANNFISYVVGLAEGGFTARGYQHSSNPTAAVARYTSIGFDSNSTSTAGCLMGYAQSIPAGVGMDMRSELSLMHTAVGFHAVFPLEYSAATDTTTWVGDGGGPSVIQSGMTLEMMM